jgi:hypothetical protein
MNGHRCKKNTSERMQKKEESVVMNSTLSQNMSASTFMLGFNPQVKTYNAPVSGWITDKTNIPDEYDSLGR